MTKGKTTLTNETIWDARLALQELLAQRFPVRTSYNLAQMAQNIQPQIKVLDDVRKGLIEKHGTKDEKTGRPVVEADTPARVAFNKEWEEILAETVEIKITKVKLPEKVASTCDKCKHNMDRPLEIEPGIILALNEFITI